jgi:hypothetical protein
MRTRLVTALLATGIALGLLAILGSNSKRVSRVVTNASQWPANTAKRSPLAQPSRTPQLTRETAPAQPHRLSSKQIDRQDSYNNTRSLRLYIQHQQRERPAYQHLPYRTDEARIEIINVTSDGRIVLEVTPLGINANPRTAYRRFLRRYHDSGASYLAQYARYEP